MERMSVHNVIHVETFNEVCKALNKVYDAQKTDWDLHVPAILSAYRTTCKKLMEQTPLRLEYGVNVVIPIVYKIPSLHIAAPVDMTTRGILEEGITQPNGAERLGPKEEIRWGDLKLQEIMKERVWLRERNTLLEATVNKLEDEIKKYFLDKKN